MNLKAAVEALVFASNGITLEKLSRILEREERDVQKVLEELEKEYESPMHGVVLKNVGGKYRFYTKPEYATLISKVSRRKYRNLTEVQMEVVALLLLSGPLSKNEIDSFRGKDSSAVLSALQKMGIVRRKRAGKSYLYQLSPSFIESTMLDEMMREISEKLGSNSGES
ncbi:SMC-Scp complex subunit ScpB [Thermotoga sp. KOL6]|uniref:SMC-Scp complex subunit ScpB n=1 Tax=Thermotoga sp. KOL6 TaxID=126741 RepID=UPI000C77BC83|nr:SMC-Scp complex subunit ScpB [Thermotoga sp. KOL6]PLV59217.1 segregation and condensation protein B [Thermotoga sp. KOL6]